MSEFTESEFTEGPWAIRVVNNGDHYRYVPVQGYLSERGNGGKIDLLTDGLHGTDKAAANAHLMAAAPDMLAVCKGIVELFEYRKAQGGHKFAIRDIAIYRQARAAIAAARRMSDAMEVEEI